MKSKNPSKQRARRGASAPARRISSAARSVILDFVLHRIQAYSREQGGGVAVHKDRNGYTLTREDTGAPIARLRPRDASGSFELLYWNVATDRWRSMPTLAGTNLSLDEALDLIAADPMDCFWM